MTLKNLTKLKHYFFRITCRACFQELLVILFLIIVVTPLQPKIRIMTPIPETVLRGLKEPGGTTVAVITPT